MFTITYDSKGLGKQLVNPNGKAVCCPADCLKGFFVGQTGEELKKSVKRAVYLLNQKFNTDQYDWNEE